MPRSEPAYGTAAQGALSHPVPTANPKQLTDTGESVDDLDARSMNETKEQIVETIRSKLLPFGIVSQLNDSGRGIHLYSIFNEPIEAGTPEAERAEHVLRRLVLYLNADRAPTHFAALCAASAR
jgi:hypothetical protein